MGQVHVQVILTNHREEAMVRLGQLAPERVHRYETEALIDTGAVRSTIPAAVADRLGLLRSSGDVYAMERVDAYYLRTARLFQTMVTSFFPWYVLARNIPRRIRRALRLS